MKERQKERLMVAMIVASQVSPSFMFSGVAVAVPSMGEELGLGATALGLVETLFLAGSVAFLLPLGRLADATNRARLYKLGLLAFGLSSGLIGVLSDALPILCLRLFQGICSALLSATGAALLADLVPAERRGRAYGASIGAIYVGLSLGPVVAGVLVDAWAWRAVFSFGGALLLVMYAVVELGLPSRWRRPQPGAIHLPSAALVLAAVLALVFGTASMARPALGCALLAAGVIVAVVFVLLQRRLSNPLLDVHALARRHVMRDALIIQLLLYMSAFCSVFMLSIFLQTCQGRGAQTSGLMLAISAVLMAVVAPVAGTLADRVRPRVLTCLGVALVTLASFQGCLLDMDASLGEVAGILVCQGLGFGLFSSPNMTVIMNSVERHELSSASALSAKARGLGMISGMLVTGLLISLRYGGEAIAAAPERFVGIQVVSFVVLAALNSAGLILGLLGLRHGGVDEGGAGDGGASDADAGDGEAGELSRPR
ncbi:MFS transporter [Pseudenhygromyxa sp. WMMC2535]|uniref:MFS transporter n=1 Tax=Pseudenhygromyxa sp. WMMC2535 TaxID=2712867 RepID=UPI001551FA99|nr:MFS transporter [Pseudenhygromyxa sp. WMMC2535]NVB40714.1 MFS transporter [Pseudenhygromyxa sp. WMMC2535]